MQVLENQSRAVRQHGVASFPLHGTGDLSFYDVNVPGYNLWSAPDRVCHPGNFVTSPHCIDHFVYPEERQHPAPVARTSGNDRHQVPNFQVPFVEWPSDFGPDAACDKYNNPIAPSNATLYPPIPQNSVATLPESLEPPKDIEWNNGSLSPVSTVNPRGGPTTQKKRNRNRLAAAKCRRKAKRGVDELQQRERDLLRENKMLNAQACLLREEVLQLKTEILRHNKCDNDYISQYIQRSARQVGIVPAEDSTCEPLNYIDF